MTDFKVGDKVRVINGIDNLIPNGSIHVIQRVTAYYIWVDDDGGWDPARFELVKEGSVPEKSEPAWVVGIVDVVGHGYDKRHESREAAFADVEDMMELMSDTDRPLIRSIVIKLEG